MKQRGHPTVEPPGDSDPGSECNARRAARGSCEVEAFHKAALAAGGRDNGGPGYRDYGPGYYAAFVYDLDGHNIEAVWYDTSKVTSR